MRIRKRQVPLPFSSLSPLPLSDPFLRRSSAAQLPQTTEPFVPKSPHPPYTPTTGPLPPSNQTNRRSPVIGSGNNGCDSSDDASGAHKKENNLKCSRTDTEDDGEEDGKMGNNTSNRGFSSAATVDGCLLKPGPSSPEFRKWFGGERDFPPKKRRVNMMEKRETEQSSSTKMKTKMNKKCDEEESLKACMKSSSSKKRARGREIMEGSRCSRVNGRGWRCCQQTLVGYSLCEHHLGKGRLRSMTSVRSRSAVTAAPGLQKKEDKRLEKEEEEDDDDDDDEKTPLMTAKKKMKLGMVKARSLSSLLGQTNYTLNMVDEIKDDDNQA